MRASTKCTKVEMLRIAWARHEAVEKLNEDRSLLLAGLRHNGYLRWKPDVRTGHLVKMKEVRLEVCEKMPERSHRIPGVGGA